ncbi:uncharacterized protein L201_003223 [Kwoniella dendrophila CBS 6074]|uniref:Uncharacterized protein n=1 Tax=Kwoniella dendrophila CBS 6074 TaxID=1295534 RepID=A0AAX4JSF1_9TREE
MKSLISSVHTTQILTIKDQVRLALLRQQIRQKQHFDKIEINPYQRMEEVDEMSKLINIMMEEIRCLKESKDIHKEDTGQVYRRYPDCLSAAVDGLGRGEIDVPDLKICKVSQGLSKCNCRIEVSCENHDI